MRGGRGHWGGYISRGPQCNGVGKNHRNPLIVDGRGHVKYEKDFVLYDVPGVFLCKI